MTVKLYKMDPSPPARAAMMALDIFGVKAELIDVNLLNKEQMSPEYVKKNPLHTVPFLEDGDLYIHDSHAILQYLADAYGKDDTWYPKDLKKRTRVNQILFFDTGYLFPRLRNVTYPAVYLGERKPPQSKLDDIVEAYGFIEEFLSKNKYIAGDNMTIADISTLSSITSLKYLIPIDAAKYPKTYAWLNEMESKPFCKKHNEPGVLFLGDYIKKNLDL